MSCARERFTSATQVWNAHPALASTSYLSQKKGGYLAAGVFNFWQKMLYLGFNGSIYEN